MPMLLEDTSTVSWYRLLTKIPVVTKMVAPSGDGSRIGRKLREASKSRCHVTWLKIGTSRPDGEKMSIPLLHGISDSGKTVDRSAIVLMQISRWWSGGGSRSSRMQQA